jgi:hypothetical protein
MFCIDSVFGLNQAESIRADLISACGRITNTAKATAPAFAWLRAGFFVPGR